MHYHIKVILNHVKKPFSSNFLVIPKMCPKLFRKIPKSGGTIPKFFNSNCEIP